jgi:hypothetical protein
MLEGDSGEEVALWRLTSLSCWSKAKFKSPCNFEESPYVAARVFSPLVIYENVDIVHMFIEILSYPLSILKVIFLESNPLRFIETLISFIKAYVYICLT